MIRIWQGERSAYTAQIQTRIDEYERRAIAEWAKPRFRKGSGPRDMIITYTKDGERLEFGVDPSGSSLQGLARAAIQLVGIPPGAATAPLSKSRIRHEIEAAFRKAGIKVLSEEEWSETPGSPAFTVRVHALDKRFGADAFVVEASLVETANLARKPKRAVPAKSWEPLRGVEVVQGAKDVALYIKEALAEFVEDYGHAKE